MVEILGWVLLVIVLCVVAGMTAWRRLNAGVWNKD